MKAVRLTCPLGHSCRTETDTEIVQCHWYVKLVGTHPQTGAEMEEWGCSMHFLPLLSVENSMTNRQVGASVQSLRNEVVKRQEQLASAAHPDSMRVIGGSKKL